MRGHPSSMYSKSNAATAAAAGSSASAAHRLAGLHKQTLVGSDESTSEFSLADQQILALEERKRRTYHAQAASTSEFEEKHLTAYERDRMQKI